jgi:ArsR family transcriptional regulator
MKQFIKVMKALSDPGRVKILKILQLKELCVCEIKALLGLAQPTISKHLKLLEEAGLVASRKDKLWVNYHLAAGADNLFALTALHNLQGWLEDDPEIKKLLARVPLIDRAMICKERASS